MTFTAVPQPGARITFGYADVLVIGHPNITSQAKGGHVVSRLVLHYKDGEEDESTYLQLGVCVQAGAGPGPLRGRLGRSHLRVRHLGRQDEGMVRAFEAQVDQRAAGTKCEVQKKDMVETCRTVAGARRWGVCGSMSDECGSAPVHRTDGRGEGGRGPPVVPLPPVARHVPLVQQH